MPATLLVNGLRSGRESHPAALQSVIVPVVIICTQSLTVQAENFVGPNPARPCCR